MTLALNGGRNWSLGRIYGGVDVRKRRVTTSAVSPWARRRCAIVSAGEEIEGGGGGSRRRRKGGERTRVIIICAAARCRASTG